MKRPICVHCGTPYGHRHTDMESVRWRDGETPPPYRGNGRVVKDIGHSYKTANRDTMRSVTMLSVNPEQRALQEAELAKYPEESFNTASRTIWDGESWSGGYDPFCTLRCALDYARKAYARSKQPAIRRAS